MEKIKCPMPLEDIKERVLSAIVDLYRYDGELLDRKANERSITHRLAEHLQRRLPNWHVDCEYNRRGDKEKRLPKSDEKWGVAAKDKGTRRVFPDIIVHRRGAHVNLVIIEAKKLHSSSSRKEDDIEKLKAFLRDPNFKYCVGLFLEVGAARESPKLTEYKRGGATEDWTADLTKRLNGLGYGE